MTAFIKRYKIPLIAAVVAAAVLVTAFFIGGDPQQHEEAAPSQIASASAATETAAPNTLPSVTEVTAQPTTGKPSAQSSATPSTTSAPSVASPTVSPTTATNAASLQESSTTAKQQSSSVKHKIVDRFKTEVVPQGKPKPVEPQEQTVAPKKATVTLSISCASVLKKLDKLDEDKLEIVPKDGWILKPLKVEINEGESVFDVTKRVCVDKKIHFEFAFTPVYNSAYVEGIGNLYEFDCGSGSGWMYQVNDWFPNYGCSRYVLKGGETVNWLYTTNIGQDIGGGYGQWSEE